MRQGKKEEEEEMLEMQETRGKRERGRKESGKVEEKEE